jgi:hypothetical protein
MFKEDGVIAMPMLRPNHEREQHLGRRRAAVRQRWQRALHYARKIIAEKRERRRVDGRRQVSASFFIAYHLERDESSLGVSTVLWV